MKKEQLVYYPSNGFNGVLFVLREPHKESGQTPEEAFNGNREWFVNKILNNAKGDGLSSQYRNRFNEMLEICGKQNLSSAAFTNINLAGGGKTAGKEYWDKDKASIISEIISTANPQYVFTCKEIFEAATQNAEMQEGITYEGDKTLRMAECDGVVFFEIYHPSYRRKIIVNK